MSYWNAFARKYPNRPLLRLDGGSVFNNAAEAPIVNRWMLEGTYRSNLDALNLTVWDIPIWQEMGNLASVGQMAKDFLKLPLVSANVSSKAPDFPAVQPFVIKSYPLDGGKQFRVGITGVLLDSDERLAPSDFQYEDPAAAVRRVFDQMKGKVDYRIVLADMDLGKAISFVVAVPDINLLVGAHNYASVSDPQQVGQTLVVFPLNEGRVLNEVRMSLKSGEAHVDSRLVELDRTVPDDPAMAGLIRKAEAEVVSFMKAKPPEK